MIMCIHLGRSAFQHQIISCPFFAVSLISVKSIFDLFVFLPLLVFAHFLQITMLLSYYIVLTDRLPALLSKMQSLPLLRRLITAPSGATHYLCKYFVSHCRARIYSRTMPLFVQLDVKLSPPKYPMCSILRFIAKTNKHYRHKTYFSEYRLLFSLPELALNYYSPANRFSGIPTCPSANLLLYLILNFDFSHHTYLMFYTFSFLLIARAIFGLAAPTFSLCFVFRLLIYESQTN